MDTPMRFILERAQGRARSFLRQQKSTADLAAIIEEEEKACAERIEARIRPLLVKEFRRVARRYGVKEVLFGNRTCLIVREHTRHLYGELNDTTPLGLRRLAAMCDAVTYSYPTSDLTEKDLS